VSEPTGDRRKWPRIPASLLTNVRASLLAGPDVTLVNISCGGALLEVGARYAMRTFVRLKLTRSTGETTVVPGTVSWSRVGTIAAGRINYLVAVIFEQAIADLSAVTGCQAEEMERAHLTPEPAAVGTAAVPAPAADPQSERARTSGTAGDESRTRQLAAADARVESLRHELDAATTDLTNLTLTNDALAAQLDAVGLERNALREELDRTRRRAAEEQARLAEQMAATAALQAALEARETEHTGALDEERTRLAAEREALARTVSGQQEDHARLLVERDHWQAERFALLEQMANAAAATDAVRAAVEAREQEHARALDEQRAHFDRRIQELTDAVSRHQTEHAQLVAQRESWEAERSTLIHQMANAAAATDAVRAAVEAREQEHARGLDEQRAQYDLRIEELLDTVSRRQQEHAQLVAERERWEVERSTLLEQVAHATAAAAAVRAATDAREQEHVRILDEQRAHYDLRIEELLDTVSRLQEQHAQLVTGRESWGVERSTLLEQLAEAVTTADAVQTALEAREQEHVHAMAAEQARYETLIAELIQAANDQHTEYQHVLAEQTAAREEECARADRQQAALQHERAAAERERSEFETRTRELEARIAALEALCAAHEARHRTLRREADKLMSVLATPVTASTSQDGVASFPVDAATEHAVA
jgi:chromosome segregation ATPase